MYIFLNHSKSSQLLPLWVEYRSFTILKLGSLLLVCPFFTRIWKILFSGSHSCKSQSYRSSALGEEPCCRYLELEHISRFQGQISCYSKPVSIGLSKHHGWRCGCTETVVLSHPFVGQHQPHTHLIHRVVKSRLLIKVLTEQYKQNRKTVLYLWKQKEMFGSVTRGPCFPENTEPYSLSDPRSLRESVVLSLIFCANPLHLGVLTWVIPGAKLGWRWGWPASASLTGWWCHRQPTGRSPPRRTRAATSGTWCKGSWRLLGAPGRRICIKTNPSWLGKQGCAALKSQQCNKGGNKRRFSFIWSLGISDGSEGGQITWEAYELRKLCLILSTSFVIMFLQTDSLAS